MGNLNKPKNKAKKPSRPTCSVRDSILKYLNRPLISSLSGNTMNKSKGELSLAERIQMREQKNDLGDFHKAHKR